MLAVFDPTNPLTWVGGGSIALAVMSTVMLFVKRWIVVGSIYEAKCRELADYRTAAKQEIDTVRATYQTAIEAARAENARIHERLEGEVFTALKEAAIAVASQNQIMRDALRK